MTEASFKADDQASTANIVIIATHGVLPDDSREIFSEPGLIFTPPAIATDMDDGFLSASEASHLSLEANLVILSACNTATHSGSELSALARSFLYSGARSVLGSNWRVSDNATAALTREFLLALQQHPALTRAQAFQEGMRSLRSGRRLDGSSVPGWSHEFADPIAWGPFVLISDRDE